jgi:hypothetical protein
MISIYFMEIIILLLLSWLFESKILPQIVVMFLAIIVMFDGLSDMSVFFMIMFASVVIYSGVQIYLGEKNEN